MSNILFVDNMRQDEIETFYEAAQRHRDYYRGYGKAHHPLLYFKEPEYIFQCPPEMTKSCHKCYKKKPKAFIKSFD